MIQATFNRSDKGIESFLITGHAESGPYGHDLVCAAVSAVSIGTVNSLIELCDVQPEINTNDEQGGYLKVQLPVLNDSSKWDNGQLLLEHLYLSLQSIQNDYSEYLSLND